MNFEFSEDQLMLKDQVRKLLSAESDSEAVRQVLESADTCSANLWQKISEMGLTGTAIPEEFGGVDAGYLELCVVAEELGRANAPIPFSSSVYLAAEVLKQSDSADQKKKYLPPIASGECKGCVAIEGEVSLSEGAVTGTLENVIDGGLADVAIVQTQDGLAVVSLADDSVSREELSTIDPTRNLANITFNNTPAETLDIADSTAALDRAINHAAILIAFEQIGGAQRALEMGCDYAKERYAFGRAIGSFQAIKHMLANMYVELELARSNCYYAAWAISTDAPELPEAAATARVSATKAFQLCAKNNIQTHGGMGFTWEADCHLYYRRSNWLAVSLGNQGTWKDKLAEIITTSVA